MATFSWPRILRTHVPESVASTVTLLYQTGTDSDRRDQVYRNIPYPHALRHAPTIDKIMEKGHYGLDDLNDDIAAVTHEVDVINAVCQKLPGRDGGEDLLDELHARAGYVLGRIEMHVGGASLPHIAMILDILTRQPKYFRDYHLRRQCAGDPRIATNLRHALESELTTYSNPTAAKFDDHTEVRPQ